MQQLQSDAPVKSSLYAVDIDSEGTQNKINGSGSPQQDNEWLPCNFGGYKQLKLSDAPWVLGDKLLIPCIVRQPYKSPYKGLIISDRGSEFDIEVDNNVITLPKIYVHPDFSEKCQTDNDISPSKKSRRKKGKGSGSIHYRMVKDKYKQAYYHYEFWSKGDRLIKSSKYIPKKMEAKIIRMNNEKVSVEEILKALRSKKK